MRKTISRQMGEVKLNMTPPKENPWAFRIFSTVMSIGLMASSWFLNNTMNRLDKNDSRVQSLELTSANRFTSQDWIQAKTLLDNERLSMDRRIIRVEENLPFIKDSLINIQKSIDKHIANDNAP